MLRRLVSPLCLTALLFSGGPAVDAQSLVSQVAPQRRGKAEPIDTGYVFIEGEYLSPPYVLAETSEGVTINGVLLTAELPRPPGPGPGRFFSGWRGGRGNSEAPPANRMGFGSMASAQGRIAYHLKSDSVLIAFEGRRLMILGGDALQLFQLLVNPEPESQTVQELVEKVANAEDRDLWASWLSTYRPPDDLRRRITPQVEAAEAAESAAHAQIAAVRRIDSFSYPLSVLGMVLAVLASGHLMSSLPPRAQEGAPVEESKVMRAALISVGLVFLLSALDLVWTILAAQAGQMRELNPLGNGLMNDPQSLVAFKSLATLMSCCLLAGLRGYHIARLASWWLCLVCTILTFRWLAFNSMFMGS